MYRLRTVNNTAACNKGQVLISQCSLLAALYVLDWILIAHNDLSYSFSVCLDAALVATDVTQNMN